MKKTCRIILVVTAMFLIRPALAQTAPAAPPQPTLTLEFEQGVDGTGRDGQTIPARVEGKAELVDGKFGKAFKTGPGAGYLHFPTTGIVSPQSGTVEMWVCPLDWNGGEHAFHSFFDARGKGALYLYKYFTDTSLLMLTAPTLNGPYHSAIGDVSNWKPGEWHFIAGTWSPVLQAVYVDGKLAATTVPDLPSSLDSEFRIGDHPWSEAGIARTSQSLIDRVRIYDHALSPAHIAAHYAGDYNKVVPFSSQSAKLDFTVDADANRITATLALMGADIDAQRARADLSIARGARIVQERRGRAFNSSSATADFSAALPPGDYELRAALHDSDGHSLGQISAPLTVPAPDEWMNNKLGDEKKVLPPWTPLVVKRQAAGLSVNCWGRDYQFGAAPLPLQITSQHQSLLKSPLALTVVSGGQPLTWTQGSARIKDASGYEVNIAGTATAMTPQGKVLLETELHLEYDGLMLLTLHLNAPPQFKPDAVTLDIPLREQVAFYHHGWSADWKAFSGNLPDGQGMVGSSPFLPATWIGDNDRGLFWFCESAEHWPNWKSANAFETRREGGAVVMRLNLLHGQELPQNWTFQCGLEATPVKPLPRDWRKWRLDPAPRANVTVPWPTDAEDSMKYFGYAEAANPQLFQKRVEALHAQGLRVVPYSLLNGIYGSAPEWKWYGKNWDVHSFDPPANVVSPTQASWRDFVIWKNKQFFDRYHLDGYYHDLTYPYGWAVASANTGWQDGAVRQKTFPMLAYRELYRRLYAVVKAAKPDAFLMGHMSSRLAIPVLAYEDSYLDGETFKGVVKDSYPDVLPLDQWRAEYMGRQWGIMPFMLPEFDAERAKQIEPTRGLVALTLLHDTAVWPIWSNLAVWRQMYDALDAFGYVDSDFIPYFDPVPPATTDMKDVYISVYKRADGRALAVIGNTSREGRQGTVTLDAKRIGLDTAQVITWPERGDVQRAGDKIELTIPGLDYRLLLIGKAPPSIPAP